MKIILSGGGTLGPVTTLLAVAKTYKERNSDCAFLWFGTKTGPEKRVVEAAGIEFTAIRSGKLRRYFSILNFFDIFGVIRAFFDSISVLKKEKPDLLVSVGGFVSVPLHWAAWLLKIPTWIHQQDVMPGLANKLMARTATKISIALEDSLQYFDTNKTEWIGNPCRDVSADRAKSKEFFGISDDEPVILAVGGGTGARKLNQMVLEAIPLLPVSWHIIHVVGPHRNASENQDAAKKFSNYKIFDFLNKEMQEDWWYMAANHTGEKVILQNTPENAEEIAATKKAAHTAFNEDKFSYFFYRTYNNHFPKCTCVECEFRKTLSSPAFIRLMQELTGLPIEKNAESFISRYGADCFLNVHNDQGNGKIAFVINLTQNWKPQYGGIFHLLTKDRLNIRKTVCPQFNSITIFKVPEPNGVPHYVSHVAPSVTKYRYAVSGWFV